MDKARNQGGKTHQKFKNEYLFYMDRYLYQENLPHLDDYIRLVSLLHRADLQIQW